MLTLSPAELLAVTGKRRAASQAAVLARMGVPFKFLGSAVALERAVAMAFALIPYVSPAQNYVPPKVPAALVAWQDARRERRLEIERESAAYAASVKAAAPEHKQIMRRVNRAKRRSAELLRIPKWADHWAIVQVYAEARKLTRSTGVTHHVDHIIPLQGKMVSGLHVADNLQVLPGTDNIRKGNRFEVE